MSDLSAVQVRIQQSLLYHIDAFSVSNLIVCLFVSIGGNAGMAAAYSARKLGVPATIIVPNVTPNITVEKMRDEGATVIIHGKVS